MKRKGNNDLLGILLDFRKNLSENKPSTDEMFEEVRMMRFKIKPLQGDVSLLDLKNKKLIEILWNLGKLDDFYHRQNSQLTENEKEVLFQFFDDLYEQFQSELSKVDLRTTEGLSVTPTIEMEIFKEESIKKKLN